MTASSPSTNTTPSGTQALFELLRTAGDWATRRELVVPLGLHATKRTGHLEITLTLLDANIPGPTTATAVSPPLALLQHITSARGVRWVSEDLLSTATVLAEHGHRPPQAMCLLLAERALNAFDGRTTDDPQAESMGLQHRYLLVCQRLRACEEGGNLQLLTRLDSANALLAAEMNAGGVGWNAVRHREILEKQALRPRKRNLYPRLAKLERGILQLLSATQVTLWHEAKEVLDAKGAEAFDGRMARLFATDHPACRPIARWRDLRLLTTRHGYEWAEEWVREDRWWPVFRPYATPAGQWASDGGAMGMPRLLRACVTAAPGRVLVHASLPQPELRMWAHLSDDPQLLPACGRVNGYEWIGRELGMDRQLARECLLAALHGDEPAVGKRALAVARSWFPDGMRYLAAMTMRGRNGELVRTRLGRTCPAPHGPVASALRRSWGDRTLEERRATEYRGRSVRVFPIQATLAELTGALVAGAWGELTTSDTRVLLFDHDELVIETTPENVVAVKYSLPRLMNIAVDQVLGHSRVDWPITVGHGANWGVASTQ